MNISVINTEKEYLAVCKKLDDFLASHAAQLDHLSTEADKEFRLLSLVIGEYENKHYPIPPADPIEFIKFMMEQKGLKVKDIAPCFGTASRAYEVLNRKRNLTLAMIRKLRVMLGCTADSLIEA